MPARVFVLAGVNGAGKSSVGGAALLRNKVDYFNPDEAARSLLAGQPAMALDAANARAWELGRKGLEPALAQGLNFAFESTPGARAIPEMLINGARARAPRCMSGMRDCRRRSCTSSASKHGWSMAGMTFQRPRSASATRAAGPTSHG
jgi:hypothetical protein